MFVVKMIFVLQSSCSNSDSENETDTLSYVAINVCEIRTLLKSRILLTFGQITMWYDLARVSWIAPILLMFVDMFHSKKGHI